MNSYEPAKKEEKKVEKVIEGKVTTRKKPLGKKFAETFLGDDIENVKSYIFFDVIVPTIKDTISNVVSSAVDMMLFGGDARPGGNRKSNNQPYVSYSNYYKGGNERRTVQNHGGRKRDFRDVIFETRGEAERVRNDLMDLCAEYGQASINDLYDLCGITGDFTDEHYGWTDLSRLNVSRVRGGGYVIDLPRAVRLD